MSRDRTFLSGTSRGRIQQALRRIANSVGIYYNDDLAAPPLGADNVQAAIDAIKAGGSTTDERVKVSAADTTTDFLSSKLIAGPNVALTVVSPGADEKLRIDSTGQSDPMDLVSCNAQSEWSSHVEQVLSNVPSLVPDVILTTMGAGDLQAAINTLGSGQVLEVRTSATYSPVVLPAVAGGYTIKAGIGFVPKISGARCVAIANGAIDVTLFGFELLNGTTPAANYDGAFITLATQNAKADRIIFANLHVHDIASPGSGVMWSYHWSVGGDFYYTPPNPATEFSTQVAFVDCRFVNAGNDNIEGGALCLRGIDQPYVARCEVDGAGVATRGIQIQDCFNALITDCTCYDFSGNGEAVKVDDLGSPGWHATYGVWNTGVIRRCFAHDATQGFDIDDWCAMVVQGCVAQDCAAEGFVLDNDSQCIFDCCSAFRCNDGFRFESGSEGTARNCMAYANVSNNYRMDNGFVPDVSNTPRTTEAGGVGGRARVSIADTTEGFLLSKIAAGSGITVSTLNPSGSEQIQVSASAIGGSGITAEGGFYFTILNATGEVSVKGKVVHPSTTVSLAAALCPPGDIDPIAVIYDAGVPIGSPMRVVFAGWADVLIQAGYSITREYWIGGPPSPGGVAGLAQCIVSPPSVAVHFNEIGHCCDDQLPKPIVVPTLARCVLHFN